jgi:mannosyltransferase
MSDAAVGAATPRSAEPAAGAGPASSRVRLAVAACTGIALALGLYHLQRRSFWQDEGFTWSTVDRSFPALFRVTLQHEGYQILHAFIEWPTNRISSTVAGLRMPSVLAFAAAVPAVWLAGRRLFDERTGVIAAFLFAINGGVLSYAQEARSYILATMLAAYAGALLAQHVLAPRRWSRAGWITFSVLTIYAHGFAVLAIAAQIFALWFLPATRRRELHWIRDGWLIALLASPALIAPIYQINSGEIAFISRPGLHAVALFVRFITGRTWAAVPSYAIGLIAALIAAITAWRKDLHSVDAFRYALLFLWLVVPTFVLLGVSFVRPIWVDRYSLWSMGALVVVCAFGLTRIAHGRALTAVVLVTALLGVLGVMNWYRVPAYEDYHAATAQIIPRLRPGDAIIFTPDEVRIPAEFYLRSVTTKLDLIPLFPPDPWGQFKTGDQHVVDVDQRTILRIDPNRYPRIWLIAFRVHTTLKPRLAELTRHYRVASDHTYRGGFEVFLFQARNASNA